MNTTECPPRFEYALSSPQMEALFPFYIAFGVDLVVRQAGASLEKLCPDIRTGVNLTDTFRFVRPEGEITYLRIYQQQTASFILRHNGSGILLRGQMLPQVDSDEILFLCSPWLTSHEDLERLGLSDAEFSIHDPTVDLMQVLRSQTIALADAKKLAERTAAQRNELREANDQLNRLNAALKKNEGSALDLGIEAHKLALFAGQTEKAIVLTDAHGRVEWVNESFVRLTGYTLDEVRGQKPGVILQGAETSPATVLQIHEHLQKGVGFHTEILNYTKACHKYWVDLEIQPIKNEAGEVTNFIALQTDITAHIKAEQRHALQQNLTRHLASADSLQEGLRDALKCIATALHWQCGLFWQPDAKSETLAVTETWHLASVELAQFMALVKAPHLKMGEWLPGKVWESQRPAWVFDVQKEASFPHAATAARYGMHGVFALPVHGVDTLCGVMEFFSHQGEEPDEDLVGMFEDLGNEIGRFILSKRAEASLRDAATLQRSILEGTNYAIISTKPDGTIQTFNWAAQRLLGYTSEELIGRQSLTTFLDADEVADRASELTHELGYAVVPGFETLSVKAQLGTPDEREWNCVRKDASRVHVQLSVTALYDYRGQILGYLGIATDVTESKQTAGKLIQAKEIAEAASRSKGELLAGLGQGLRAPLGEVLAQVESLRTQNGGPLNERQQQQVCAVEERSRHLQSLINDILDLANLDQGRLEPATTECSAEEVCKSLSRLIAPTANRKHQVLSTRIQPLGLRFRADRRYLVQILMNLLGNAVKFTPEKGHVDLHILGNPAEKQLSFSVLDTGIGIDSERVARLFQPAKAQESGRGIPSHGGLALAQKLAEKMGAKISVESHPGTGSCFTLTLPWEAVGEIPETAAKDFSADDTVLIRKPPAGTAKELILLVEDSAMLVKAVSSYLSFKGYQVAVARNGREGWELAANLKPALILMDIQMPETDGIEATRRIRASSDKQVADVPIVALTGMNQPADRERCLSAGASAYLSKPVEFSILIATIEQLLPKK